MNYQTELDNILEKEERLFSELKLFSVLPLCRQIDKEKLNSAIILYDKIIEVKNFFTQWSQGELTTIHNIIKKKMKYDKSISRILQDDSNILCNILHIESELTLIQKEISKNNIKDFNIHYYFLIIFWQRAELLVKLDTIYNQFINDIKQPIYNLHQHRILMLQLYYAEEAFSKYNFYKQFSKITHSTNNYINESQYLFIEAIKAGENHQKQKNGNGGKRKREVHKKFFFKKFKEYKSKFTNESNKNIVVKIWDDYKYETPLSDLSKFNGLKTLLSWQKKNV